MLFDIEAFERIEKVLHEKGKIEEFEKENDKIKGRMMITLGNIPDDLEIELKSDCFVFIGSFDFYDATVGIAIDKETKELASALWITPQVDDAEQPSDDWIEFFFRILAEYVINADGFGVPICCFLTDESEMIIVPTV
ncbi:MAG: hypothetical protein ACOX1A_07400 [Saccharofermentanales bacterium]